MTMNCWISIDYNCQFVVIVVFIANMYEQHKHSNTHNTNWEMREERARLSFKIYIYVSTTIKCDLPIEDICTVQDHVTDFKLAK